MKESDPYELKKKVKFSHVKLKAKDVMKMNKEIKEQVNKAVDFIKNESDTKMQEKIF